jgi:hypothetical protein
MKTGDLVKRIASQFPFSTKEECAEVGLIVAREERENDFNSIFYIQYIVLWMNGLSWTRPDCLEVICGD